MKTGMLTDHRASSMAEAAISMPVVLLVLMFAINASLAAYTGVAAANAVNYGARIGSVTRENAEQWAKEAVKRAWDQSGAGGAFSYSVLVGERPNGVVMVTGRWSYPTILSGLCEVFGGSCPSNFQGTVTAVYRKEGY
ncbi:MAG: pilus assembly protein [Anaerolineales bacterium]|nr:pilus assembly protein [Anaerolineales bacterium]